MAGILNVEQLKVRKMQLRSTLTILFIASIFMVGFGQDKQYRILGTLENYNQDTVFLGQYFMDKQYLVDTAVVDNYQFTFSDTSTLHPGVYLIVMPPDNKYFQLMVSDSNQVDFAFKADFNDIEKTVAFTNSPDNELFYRNMRYVGNMRSEYNALSSEAETASEEEKGKIEASMQALSAKVQKFQEKMVTENPSLLTSALVRSGFKIDIPEFGGTPEEVNLQRYRFYKMHYFDHVDLSDARLLRSPSNVLYDRVKYYLEKLTPQHPDSIITSVDYLLSKMKPAGETYRQYLVKFLNDYAASKIVGMDAVYVHLALEYYAKGEAPWVEVDQLAKIVGDARNAEPTLIGKLAPNLVVQRRDSTDVSLYDIESEYVVLIFWSHDCQHCKESMPKLKEFYNRRSIEGIEVLSVCTKFGKDEPPCWEFVDDKALDGWINASDKTGGRSRMHQLFNIKKTPKLFVLDKDKKIISKDIGVEQLDNFCDRVILNSK